MKNYVVVISYRPRLKGYSEIAYQVTASCEQIAIKKAHTLFNRQHYVVGVQELKFKVTEGESILC